MRDKVNPEFLPDNVQINREPMNLSSTRDRLLVGSGNLYVLV